MVRKTFLYPLIGRATVDTGIYSTGNTPGVEGAPYVTILLVIFLILSLREKSRINYETITKLKI